MSRCLLVGFLGVALSCATPSLKSDACELSLGSATLHLGEIRTNASFSRVRGAQLHIAPGPGFPRSWSFELVLFDDRNGDGEPDDSELLLHRQALGSRPENLRFPDLRFAGHAVRPHAQVRFRDGPDCRFATVPLSGD